MQTRFFSALGPETEEQIKLAKKKFTLTCSLMIRTCLHSQLQYSGEEKRPE